jgi:type II secretory pathway component PulF
LKFRARVINAQQLIVDQVLDAHDLERARDQLAQLGLRAISIQPESPLALSVQRCVCTGRTAASAKKQAQSVQRCIALHKLL